MPALRKPKPTGAFMPVTALAKSVKFDDDMMHVELTDGRILSVPLIWFPVLHKATPQQRKRCKIGPGGLGLHWRELEEDLSIAGLLAGGNLRSA